MLTAARRAEGEPTYPIRERRHPVNNELKGRLRVWPSAGNEGWAEGKGNRPATPPHIRAVRAQNAAGHPDLPRRSLLQNEWPGICRIVLYAKSFASQTSNRRPAN